MAALLLVGTAVFYLTVPISLAIVALLFIVATSYRQTVLAYPGGGGAYIVARENLGIVAAQVAGSAILIDYILTVAVSVSSGVAAIRSLAWTQYGVTIPIVTVAVAAVIVVALINLRGVKESGAIFAIPTYIFIAIVTGLIGFGVWLFFHQTIPTAWPAETFKNAVPGGYSELRPLGWFLILQAFASGCAALTGVEAISDGCTAFKQPVGRNAAITMVWLAVILGFLFLGLSWLAVQVQALPETAVGVHETVVSQIGRSILGAGQSPVGTVIYFLLQVFTALILVLAANTSFAGFPRLAAIIARDGFLPKQLGNLGDRLVFDRGIITLTILSVALIIWKKAD
ncbi:MAG: APC family permease, partial [Armatimonadetes bacterium]|nr:APC family permease [Armatimonadota bacterium]